MKKTLLKTVFAAMAIFAMVSCTNDNDYVTPSVTPMIFSDDFSFIADNPNSLEDRGWTRFTEAGTKPWKEDVYSKDAYAVFTGYDAIPENREVSNIGWLISPGINMDNHDGEKLLFQAAQAYVTSSANSLELLISTDYDGDPANTLNATWTSVPFTQPTLAYAENFNYVNSAIDLSSYTGTLHFAFRVVGSGTVNGLTGTYQIDNIRVIY